MYEPFGTMLLLEAFCYHCLLQRSVLYLQAPCIVMVEGVDDKNLFIFVSSPNLNLNISRDNSNPLVNGNEVTDNERFYSVSMAVDVEVRIMDTC